LEKLNVKYGLATTPFEYEVNTSSNAVEVSINKSIPNLEINYHLNNGMGKIAYQDPLLFDQFEPILIVSAAERNGEIIGDPIPLKVHPHLALNKSVLYLSEQYSGWYTAGGQGGLVDGVLGSLDFRDGHWQGFWGKDLECVIDLEGITSELSSVEANFYQYNNSWIFIPKEMLVEVSDEGKVWNYWGIAKSKADPRKRGKFIETFKIEGEATSFRYLKIRVKNFGKIPDWHEAAGSDAWIFIDEIIIK